MLAGVISVFSFSSFDTQAQTVSNYKIIYSESDNVEEIIQTENEKGCVLLHHTFFDRRGRTGELEFTCDQIIPPQLRELTVDQFLNELAERDGVILIPSR